MATPKAGWEVKALGEVAQVNYGYTAKAGREPVGPKFLRITDIQEGAVDWDEVPYCPISDKNFRKQKLEDGDIVFARTGATTGKSFLVKAPPESVAASYLIRLRLNATDVSPCWLTLFFQTKAYWDAISFGIEGAAQGGFNASKLSKLVVPLPPLPEQERIVGILDEAFEGIAAATAQAEKNLHNARELFQSVLQSTFSQKGDDWVETTIGDLCKITHGFAFKGKDFGKDNDSAKPIVITPGNFTEDAVLSFTDRNTKRFSGESPSGFTFDEGDLVVIMTDLSSKMKILGKPAFIDRPDILHNQRIGRVVMADSSVLPELLYYFFRTNVFLGGIKLSATGTMVKHTAPKRICMASFSYPPEATTQQAIVEKLDALSEETKRLEAIYERKQSALAELKQTLLQKAFAGEL